MIQKVWPRLKFFHTGQKLNAPELHSWSKKKEKSIHNMQYCTCEYQFQL